MATLYEQKFRDTLAEMFQLDQAELDFGIYRIMNQKRQDINRFLNLRLVPEVTKTLQANADEGADLSAMENEVFSHLTRFFSRYYDGGDFISKRRYKDDTYAIPYSGEEVKLYWANADQYYIKTTEYFKNYAFLLPESRRKVHFVLRDAETEQNNNKAASNMERRFALCEEDFIAEVDGELCIYFTYELMPKATKQDALVKDAEAALLPVIAAQFSTYAELATTKAPTEKNRDRSLLMKHLQDYTAKNTFDYFIHKDLGGFLRRELDFYIKNEVMYLDDLDASHILSHLAQVKAIKQVGEKIIAFLAQLEDFQKKLWLKKKFVVGCDYCITLDRIPHALYPEILRSEAQRQEWVRLFAIDEVEGYTEPLTSEFLTANPFLVLDTKFFSADFKHKVVESMEHVDEDCNGLLINSENFQAIKFLRDKYCNSFDCMYLDPPYNTGPSEILYKNSYKNSSWLSLMENRLAECKSLMHSMSSFCLAIDDFEQVNLSELVDLMYPSLNRDTVVVKHHPQGTNKDNISRTHEYALIYTPCGENVLQTEKELTEYDYRPLMRSGSASNNYRYGRPKSFYAFLVDVNTHKVMGYEPAPLLGTDYRTEPTKEGWARVYPISNGIERCWRISSVSEKLKVDDLNTVIRVTEKNSLYQIIKSKKEPIESVWTDKRYNAGTYGTNIIQSLFGDASVFSYPKSLYTVQDYIDCVTDEDETYNVIDFFAGSGTTGHAVINLNKADNGKRKYYLVEMGNYFNSATKPRIEKVIYSEDWKNGKPVSRNGISQCFKYLRLEQYEDTLNNLQTRNQQLAFKDERADFEESYLLGYMLDTETKGDLFNLQWFVHPFDMTLKTTQDNELVETPVDMVETFNYLIGLEVESMRWPKDGYCVVEGTMHTTGERTLVIWRDCEKVSNDALNEFFHKKQDYNVKDAELDKIYVNGDNTLPNIRTDEEHWKVVLIEEEFKKRMFEHS